jgi:hypothetical protein
MTVPYRFSKAAVTAPAAVPHRSVSAMRALLTFINEADAQMQQRHDHSHTQHICTLGVAPMAAQRLALLTPGSTSRQPGPTGLRR